ncbi:MAG: sodium:proton antiporter [Candidatus Methylomirabilis sp.]
MRSYAKWQAPHSPIVEVAVIFAGIFATMIPALAILEARGGDLGLKHPWQFFWVTGASRSSSTTRRPV